MAFRLRQIVYSAGGRRIARDRALPGDRLTVGRGADNDIQIPDLAVEPNHAVITLENPADHLVQFKKGKQIAGIKVSSLGDNLTHLLVSSAQTGGQPSASATVLNSVLRVCRDMNVECAPMQN